MKTELDKITITKKDDKFYQLCKDNKAKVIAKDIRDNITMAISSSNYVYHSDDINNVISILEKNTSFDTDNLKAMRDTLQESFHNMIQLLARIRQMSNSDLMGE